MSRLPPFEPDLARASTLPAFAYTDADVFAEERTKIFARTWQPVGAAEDVRAPGSYFTAELASAPVVVTRDAAGVLRGFYNVCRHRAGPVAIGKGTRRSLTCRYHGWTYGLDGALVSTPELGAVEGFDRTCHGLRPVRVEQWGPLVFANLAPDAAPLSSVLGDIPRATAPYALEAMRVVERREYVIRCNWKVYVDNFLEGYHLPTVHPSLYRELDYDAYRVETFDLYSSQIAPLRPAKPGTPGRQYTEDGEGALYYWVFPNWMLNIYPDNMSLNVVVPLGLDETLTLFEWYRPEPVDPAAVAKTVAFSDEIQREDIAICESVQKGLASGAYDTGRFSALRENGVHHFQQLVHAYLTGAR